MEQQLDRWALWMKAASHKDRTVRSRLDLVALFARRTGVDPIVCGWEAIAAFLADDRFAPSTRRQYRAILHQWFAFLVRMGIRPDNPVDVLARVRVPRAVPRPVSTGQLDLALASRRFYSRTRTMILLGAFQGLRVSEIAKFRGDDISDGLVHVLGKGDVSALIPLHPVILDEAEDYPESDYWFPSPVDRTRPITGKNVSAVVGAALRRAGVDATAHQLRHWYGTEVMRSSGGNVRTAQECLRHANIASTAIYTGVDDEQKRGAVNGLPVPPSARERATQRVGKRTWAYRSDAA